MSWKMVPHLISSKGAVWLREKCEFKACLGLQSPNLNPIEKLLRIMKFPINKRELYWQQTGLEDSVGGGVGSVYCSGPQDAH